MKPEMYFRGNTITGLQDKIMDFSINHASLPREILMNPSDFVRFTEILGLKKDSYDFDFMGIKVLKIGS